ncbi:hypothetical protein EC839_1262 [Pseudomonas sp. JUb52]|nr:hypothetical protein EC839_1262 [Pseudomonas sp. JUb52]
MARPGRPSMMPPKAPVPAAQEQRAPSEEALERFYNSAPDAPLARSKPVDSDEASTSKPEDSNQISSSTLVGGKPKKSRQTTQKISLGVRLDLLPLADESASRRHMDRSKYINFALAEQIKRDREEFGG